MATNQDFSEFLRQNKNLIKEYTELRLELFKLQGVKLLSRSLSLFVWLTIVLLVIFFILLFLGMLLAYWIAEKTGSTLLGFAISAGAFGIILLFLVIFRKSLFRGPITRTIIREALEENQEES